MVTNRPGSTKPVLKLTQHLAVGTYYVDIHHGFVADNTAQVGATAVKVTPVKRYHLRSTASYELVLHGIKADKTVAPTEPVKPQFVCGQA